MSYCNEPSQSSKTIVVERSVFEELVKTAEKGKLANKAVGSFESERKVLLDSLDVVKAENVKLVAHVKRLSSALYITIGVCVLILAVLGLIIWLERK